MTTPNKITVFRFCLIPVFTAVFLLEEVFPDKYTVLASKKYTDEDIK